MSKKWCTLYPDLWYGSCCAQHDKDIKDFDKSFIKSNLELAKCVREVTVKENRTKFEYIWGRYISPVLMFTGTSTFGWIWRGKHYLNHKFDILLW